MKNNEKTNVFLVRHAESYKNLLNVFSNKCDYHEITKLGERQIENLTSFLRKFSFLNFNVYSDDDTRSYQTAQLISQIMKLNYFSIDFKSIDVGLLKGLSMEKVKNQFPGIYEKEVLYRSGKLDGYQLEYPKGESILTFQNKTIKTYNHILSESRKSTPLIITHQSVIAAILNFYNRKSERKFHFIDLGYCSVSLLNHFQQSYSISFINHQTST
jgi:broad specificity phosphatase PhoE